MTNIPALEHQITEAEQAFNHAHKGLRRTDGAPVYSDAETEERETGTWRTFRRELARIGDALDTAVGDAEATIAAIETADLTGGFSTDELQRISVRTVFVIEDLKRRTPDARLVRLRQVSESGKREDRYLYLRVARLLRDEALAAQGPTIRNEVPIRLSTELDEVIADLEAGFIDGRKRDTAREHIAEAQRVGAKLAGVRYQLSAYATRGRAGAVTTGSR